jgi:hypothetical protein
MSYEIIYLKWKNGFTVSLLETNLPIKVSTVVTDTGLEFDAKFLIMKEYANPGAQ